MQENKDSRLKYIEMVNQFRDRANTVDFQCKASQRICERLAKTLTKERPKTPLEFERHEYLKDFILKTSANNEATLELLNWMNGFLQDIATDAKVLIDGAILRDKLDFQSETIQLISQQRDELVNDLCKRNS
jgi:hypothetical protein